MKLPLVSIIMATYNRAHFIEETLESIKAQTFQDWECLIIDDGGTDATAEIVQKHIDVDSRFTYQKRTDAYQKGLPGSRNNGIALARGTYIVFFDDDDIVHPKNLELCVHYLESSQLDFCRYKRTTFAGAFNYVFDDREEFGTFKIDGKQDVYKMISGVLPFNSCAVMWKKECFDTNTFTEHLMFAEEWECYSRILMQGAQGISIDKVLFYGRKHAKSNTGEFQTHNPVRFKSKIDAACLILDHLNKHQLLHFETAKYFLALSKRLKAKRIFDHLIEQSTLRVSDKKALQNRYTNYKWFMAGYKIKNLLKFN